MPERTGSSTRFTAPAPAPVAAVCAALFAAAIVRADVIYVDDSATAGANTGQSWRDAFTDLQSALAIAQAGDEIRVAQGTYKPAPPGGDRTISFNLVSGTILQGGYAGFGASDPDANDPEKFETILSGDLDGDDAPAFQNTGENSFNVIVGNDLSSATTMRGVTIARGLANHTTNCEGASDHSAGGGLRCENSNMLIEDCLFAHNRASCSGGGMVIEGGSPTLRRCRFEINGINQTGSDSFGGAIRASGMPMFIDCAFIDNSVAWYGGAAYVSGGVFWGCLFESNSADETGGAVSGSGFALVDCVIDGNAADRVGGVSAAGNSLILNCTFTGNCSFMCAYPPGSALRLGGNSHAVNCLVAGNSGSSPAIGITEQDNSITSCTVVGNTSFCDPGGIAVLLGQGNISNCLVWANAADDAFGQAAQIRVFSTGQATIVNSSIEGWTGTLGGVGNHGNDPRFIDADGPDDIYGTPDDDPRLRPNSPCIDSGDATLLPPDEFDLDDDGDVTEPLPIDLDGLQRVVGANLDMGAFEFQGIPCPADINGDASVEVDDLRAVISSWGPCVPGEECNADLNLDFTVSIDDLLAVITAWGPCS